MPSPKTVEILAIGDELLLGIRTNSHLVYLGDGLSRHGFLVRRGQETRDHPADLARAFLSAWEDSDIVITTGGLGPTVDDLTRETLAQALGVGLVESAEAKQAIAERFARLGRVPTANNAKQAHLLEGAEMLPNPNGTAPGQWFERDGKLLIMLPGPTSEIRPMFEEQVLPRLINRGLAIKGEAYLQFRTVGVGESQLETILAPHFERFGERLQVAYCAHSGLVDVRLSSLDPSLTQDQIKSLGETCRNLLGDDFACFGDCGLAALVLRKLRSLGKNLAIAESCTGGDLSSAFTDIPGASKAFLGGIVCYTNDAKVQLLDVPEAILQQHGAVSAECAVALATGVTEKFGADYGLSVTGFAGPGGGTPENPVGTIFLGYASPVGVWSRKVQYPGNRLAIKERAVNTALDFLRRKLLKYELQDVLDSMRG